MTLADSPILHCSITIGQLVLDSKEIREGGESFFMVDCVFSARLVAFGLVFKGRPRPKVSTFCVFLNVHRQD